MYAIGLNFDSACAAERHIAVEQAPVHDEVTALAAVQGGYTLSTANAQIAGISGKTISGNSAGSTTVTATSAFDPGATGTVNVTVVPKSLSGATVTTEGSPYTYTGSAWNPEVTVTLNGNQLISGTDYDTSISDNIDAGTANITVTGKGNYKDAATGQFTIEPRSVGALGVTIDDLAPVVYNSTDQTPEPVVKYGARCLVKGTDYTLTYSNNRNAGEASVTIIGMGNFTRSKTKSFTIQKKPLTADMVSLDWEEAYYSGALEKPTVTVTDAAGDDYTVTNAGGTDCGEYEVTVTAKDPGNLTGSVTRSFEIVKARNAITKFTVTGGKEGTAPLYSWDLNSKFGSDEAVISFSTSRNGVYAEAGPTKAGTYYARAFIPGTENYSEVTSQPVEFKIQPEAAPEPKPKKRIMLKPTTIRNTIANTVATPKYKWVIYDRVDGATSYELAYKHRNSSKWVTRSVGNSIRAQMSGLSVKGLYEVKVKAKSAETPTQYAAESAYSPIVYRYFFTVQKIRLVSRSKGSFTMSWATDSDSTGYQVMFTTNANGAGAAANINTLGRNATSFTKTGLKSGTAYYVQVRALRKIGDKTYVGNISCPVKVMVK